MEALHEPRRDDPDHALVPIGPGDDVCGAATLRLRPLLDLSDRVPEDATFDGLPVAVQLLELLGEAARRVAVVRQ